eukprot:GHRR01023941.1.p1 GENE.GHRR01023941.1~~GHRR01023941.1.p1  ORF type:complete len:149 (+),score=22.29 GHRR01023941.1:482-928(+)
MVCTIADRLCITRVTLFHVDRGYQSSRFVAFVQCHSTVNTQLNAPIYTSSTLSPKPAWCCWACIPCFTNNLYTHALCNIPRLTVAAATAISAASPFSWLHPWSLRSSSWQDSCWPEPANAAKAPANPNDLFLGNCWPAGQLDWRSHAQ